MMGTSLSGQARGRLPPKGFLNACARYCSQVDARLLTPGTLLTATPDLTHGVHP